MLFGNLDKNIYRMTIGGTDLRAIVTGSLPIAIDYDIRSVGNLVFTKSSNQEMGGCHVLRIRVYLNAFLRKPVLLDTPHSHARG